MTFYSTTIADGSYTAKFSLSFKIFSRAALPCGICVHWRGIGLTSKLLPIFFSFVKNIPTAVSFPSRKPIILRGNQLLYLHNSMNTHCIWKRRLCTLRSTKLRTFSLLNHVNDLFIHSYLDCRYSISLKLFLRALKIMFGRALHFKITCKIQYRMIFIYCNKVCARCIHNSLTLWIG